MTIRAPYHCALHQRPAGRISMRFALLAVMLVLVGCPDGSVHEPATSGRSSARGRGGGESVGGGGGVSSLCEEGRAERILAGARVETSPATSRPSSSSPASPSCCASAHFVANGAPATVCRSSGCRMRSSRQATRVTSTRMERPCRRGGSGDRPTADAAGVPHRCHASPRRARKTGLQPPGSPRTHPRRSTRRSPPR